MKRVAFSVYVEMNDRNFKEYLDRLIKNKKDYCDSHEIEYFVFDDIKEIEQFKEDYEFDDLYIAINNFKLYKLEQLSYEYDEILYLDMDVVCNTDKNFFEEIDLEKGLFCVTQDVKDWWTLNDGYEPHHTSPDTKYALMNALKPGKNYIINTGVVGGKSKHIQQLNYVNSLINVKNKIRCLKDDTKWKEHFTPNNEAIFGYLLRENNVPWQEDHDWHDIRDDLPIKKEYGNFIHLINKCFWSFFKDKTKVIYSLYIDIPEERLDNDGHYHKDSLRKSERTKERMSKYYQKLLNNQASYALEVGATYIHFTNDKMYEEYRSSLLEIIPDMSEYNIVNFYKIYLMYELAKTFDHILYLDFDVVCNTDIDFFEYSNLEKKIYCFYEDTKRSMLRFLRSKDGINWDLDYRSPMAKQWNAEALLCEYGFSPDARAFNTGVVGASKNMLSKLDYFKDFEDILDTMKFLKKEEGMYPEKVQNAFGYDNETVFGFRVVENDVPICIIGDNFGLNWHYQITDESKKEEMHKHLFLHFINKRFEYYFDSKS